MTSTASHHAPIRIKAVRVFFSLSPWHLFVPQKTFGSIPVSIGFSSNIMVVHQPCMAHGIGETVNHVRQSMILYYPGM